MIFLANVKSVSAGAIAPADEKKLKGLCPSDTTACSALLFIGKVRMRISRYEDAVTVVLDSPGSVIIPQKYQVMMGSEDAARWWGYAQYLKLDKPHPEHPPRDCQ